MSYISDTLQPARFGEIYSLFNTRLDGEVKWNSTDKTLQTRGLKIFTTPITGGGQAITLIPDGLYPMTSLGSALWIKLTRYSGSATASPVPYDSSQPTPSQDWIQLAYRSDTNIINLFGGSIAGNGAFSRPGTSRGGGLYDAIVGPVSNPVATHTSIQTAIDDCLDGNRILILQGTYNIASPGNAGLDANSALAWSGKTLSIEGQGYGTVIVNGALTTAFFIKANASGLGTASQIKNLKIQNFGQTVTFNGSLGAINDCNIEVYSQQANQASYTAPSIIGEGNENFVKEWVMPFYKIIESRVSAKVINVTGNITIGDNVVSNLSSTAGIAVGQKVVGGGIPTNTFIIYIAGNQITLNKVALATTTTVALTISSVAQSVTKENSITTISGTLKLPSLSAVDATSSGDAVVLGYDNELSTLGYSTSAAVNNLVKRDPAGIVRAGSFFAASADTTNMDRIAVRETSSGGTYRWATAGTISSFLGNTDLDLTSLHITGTSYIGTQGAWIQWNKESGDGATWFFNQRGSGSGGFIFSTAGDDNTYSKICIFNSKGLDFYGRQAYVRSAIAKPVSFLSSFCQMGNEPGGVGVCGGAPFSTIDVPPAGGSSLFNIGAVFMDYHIGPKYDMNGDDENPIGMSDNQTALSFLSVDVSGNVRRILSFVFNTFQQIGGQPYVLFGHTIRTYSGQNNYTAN